MSASYYPFSTFPSDIYWHRTYSLGFDGWRGNGRKYAIYVKHTQNLVRLVAILLGGMFDTISGNEMKFNGW